MKVFQDLSVHGDRPEALAEALATITLASWTRDVEAEEHGRHLDPQATYLAFVREEDADLPRAGLSLARDEAGWTVANIVPLGGVSLSHATYNALLRRFQAELAPVANGLGLEVRTTEEDRAVADLVPGEPGRLLTAFSGAANKNTGASHPSDFRRWAAFLASAHRNHLDLDWGSLERLLVEELGWPEGNARELGSDYSFARDLLRLYDGA